MTPARGAGMRCWGRLLEGMGRCGWGAVPVVFVAGALAMPSLGQQVLTGQKAFTDFAEEHPGVERKLTPADLPQPYATESVMNDAHLVVRPAGMMPVAPPGFTVSALRGWICEWAPDADGAERRHLHDG